MKITGIRAREVRIPLPRSYTLSSVGTVVHTRSVVLELFTDEGLVGLGETDPELMFSGESQHTVMTVLNRHLGPVLLGRNPLNVEKVHALMNAVCVGNHFAKAAVDLACHDIGGRV